MSMNQIERALREVHLSGIRATGLSAPPFASMFALLTRLHDRDTPIVVDCIVCARSAPCGSLRLPIKAQCREIWIRSYGQCELRG